MVVRFNFHNPSLRWRVTIVAAVYSGVGALAGMLASLLLRNIVLCTVIGAGIGAYAGAALEAFTDADPPEAPLPRERTRHDG